jgi:hypothetical protein
MGKAAPKAIQREHLGGWQFLALGSGQLKKGRNPDTPSSVLPTIPKATL